MMRWCFCEILKLYSTCRQSTMRLYISSGQDPMSIQDGHAFSRDAVQGFFFGFSGCAGTINSGRHDGRGRLQGVDLANVNIHMLM